MDKKQMPISELPFNFDGLEPQYGQIKHAELICPGVYFIMTKFNTDRPRFAGEYLVVTEDSPAISPEARNFTTPLPTIPRMFLLWHLRTKSKMAKKRKPAATVFIPIGRAAVRSLKCFRMTRMAGDKKSTVRRCKTRS